MYYCVFWAVNIMLMHCGLSDKIDNSNEMDMTIWGQMLQISMWFIASTSDRHCSWFVHFEQKKKWFSRFSAQVLSAMMRYGTVKVGTPSWNSIVFAVCFGKSETMWFMVKVVEAILLSVVFRRINVLNDITNSTIWVRSGRCDLSYMWTSLSRYLYRDCWVNSSFDLFFFFVSFLHIFFSSVRIARYGSPTGAQHAQNWPSHSTWKQMFCLLSCCCFGFCYFNRKSNINLNLLYQSALCKDANAWHTPHRTFVSVAIVLNVLSSSHYELKRRQKKNIWFKFTWFSWRMASNHKPNTMVWLLSSLIVIVLEMTFVWN